MINTVKISHKKIGLGQPVFVIAEAGVNHNGDLKLAKKLIDVAAASGADAIKFQTFTAELLVTAKAAQAKYQTKNTGKKESQLEMLKRLELPRAWHKDLQKYCATKKIIFLSTPFSESDATFLNSINVPAFKVSSGDLTNLPLLAHLAKFKKPLIISTGMADLSEVQAAVKCIVRAGNKNIIVLHSTSNYPPSAASLNLKAINTLQKKFPNLAVGYSDNGSVGFVADVAAVALGANVIEKHFTLDKNLPGPDHSASLNPQELDDLVSAIRETEVMLGSGEKKPAREEADIMIAARKSVVANVPIAKGTIIIQSMLTTRRPGTGLSPAELPAIVGKRALKNLAAGDLLKTSDYE